MTVIRYKEGTKPLCSTGPITQAALETSSDDERHRVAVRLRTTPAKRYKKVENATAVIWKVLRVVEKSFRRLDAPELLGDVASGVSFVDGIRQRLVQREGVA